MTIQKKMDNDRLTVALEGRLDTVTAPQLEEELKGSFDGVKELVFDLEKLDYISSAGLRVLLWSQKNMNKQGSMIIRSAKEDLMEIFEVTGFIDIFSFE